MSGVTIAPAPTYLARAPVSFSTNGTNTIVSGIPGQVVRVYRIFFVTSAATTVTIQDGGTNLSGAIPLGQNGSVVLDTSGDPWYQSSPGNPINITSNTTAQISGSLWYTQTGPLGG